MSLLCRRPLMPLAALAILAGTLAATPSRASESSPTASESSPEPVSASCQIDGPQLTGFALAQQPYFYYGVEGAGSASFQITVPGHSCGDESITVSYDTPPAVATVPSDYTRATGSVQFTADDHFQFTPEEVAVPLANDTLQEAAAEGFKVILTKAEGTRDLGFPTQAPLYIVDDDGLTRVRFESAAQSVVEGATVTIPVFRAGPATGTVNYTVQAGPAPAGDPTADLVNTPSTGQVSGTTGWRMGTITVNTANDTSPEQNENVKITLSGPQTETPSELNLKIIDNDTTHTLQVTKSGTGTITSSPAGIFCGGDCTQAYAGGTEVTLFAGGGTFLGWSGDCAGTATYCFLTMNAAKNVTATFSGGGGGTHTLTVTKNPSAGGTVTSSPSGINCGATCSASFADATSVTLTAAAATGYTFGNWSGGCTGTSTQCTVTMNASKTVTATFNATGSTRTLSVTKNGSGTVTSSPAGINCGTDCAEAYSDGTGVTLTATPARGKTFTNWSGDCTGTSTTCNLTMNADRSVTANFSDGTGTTYTLQVTVNGTGSGTVTSSPAGINCPSDCTESYAGGTPVTLTETAAGSSTFGGWSGACTGSSTTCNLTMSAAKNVTATFNASGGGDLTPPTSRFHHPKNGFTYDYDNDSGLMIREVHVFTDDVGSGAVQSEMALRKKKINGTCEWWTGSGFTAGSCTAKVWQVMTPYDPDAFLYNFPEFPSSVGTAVRNYRAWCRATDTAANVESIFEVGRNNNTFEVAPNSP